MTNAAQTLNSTECDKLLSHLLNDANYYPSHRTRYRNYLMALLMLDAGLRVGEVAKMQTSTVWISDGPVSSLTVHKDISKGGRERTVPCTPRLRTAIKTYITEVFPYGADTCHKPLFMLSFNQRPITVRRIQQIIKSAGRWSIRRDIHPHILRHTFATRLMEKTNIRVVQELLGHKSIQSTQVYTHPNSQHLRDAIAKI